MSTLKVNQWLNSDGTENYKCRAWTRITVAGGVPSVAASGNVGSVTDAGVGLYTLNFTTALSDVNYAFTGGGQHSTGAVIVCGNTVGSRSTSVLPLATYRSDAAGFADVTEMDVAVFR